METPRKINIFRLDLPTEDAAREKPFANVSFYLNKTHIFKINYDVAQRAHSPYQAHWAHSCRTCVPYFLMFIMPKKSPVRGTKKRRKYAGKKRLISVSQKHLKQNVLTKRNGSGS